MNMSLRNHDRLKANCAPRASLLTSTTRFWSGEKSHWKEDLTTVCRYTRHLREREGDREREASGDECGGTDLWQSLRSLVEARKKGNPTSASLDRVQEAISAGWEFHLIVLFSNVMRIPHLLIIQQGFLMIS